METPDPRQHLFGIIVDFWTSQAVHVAARLGLADHLRAGPRDADAIAEATGTHAPSLARLLRALASAGVLHESGDRYTLTPLGEMLRSDGPGSQRSIVDSLLGGAFYRAWGELRHSIETGRPAFEHVFGMHPFDYFAEHPEEAALFNSAMTAFTAAVGPAVLEAFDFSPYRTIVDVGGGHGRLLASILEASPKARGVLYDSPRVVDGAEVSRECKGLAGRIEAVGGDFFESVPGGGDLYILKGVIHDWNDRPALTILRNCRRAMTEDGSLLLIESVLADGDDSPFGRFLDLNMLVMVDGKERTESEFRTLLGEAGFALAEVRPTRSTVSLIVAEPIPGPVRPEPGRGSTIAHDGPPASGSPAAESPSLRNRPGPSSPRATGP